MLIVSLLTAAPLFADEEGRNEELFDSFVTDDMKIRIRDVGVSDSLRATSEGEKAFLYVTLDFVNTNNQKKFDLSKNIQFILKDEYDNTYLALPEPEHYSQVYLNKNSHYPSLYPNEVYTQTYFFEPPLNASAQLFLSFDGAPYDLSNNIVLHISKDQYMPDDKESLDDVLRNGIKLKALKTDISVAPGARYPVKVELSKEIKVKPAKIYVISPDYLYEDFSGEGIYQVKVPPHHPIGPFQILVIAEWSKGENMPTLSDSLTLNVVDPFKKCQDSCLNEPD